MNNECVKLNEKEILYMNTIQYWQFVIISACGVSQKSQQSFTEQHAIKPIDAINTEIGNELRKFHTTGKENEIIITNLSNRPEFETQRINHKYACISQNYETNQY